MSRIITINRGLRGLPGQDFTPGNTDSLAEGVTNLYHTDARARAAQYVYSGTWAGRPAVGSYAVGDKILITDIGVGPVEMINTGADWCPAGGEAILYMLKLPVGVASTFTGTTDGAFTLGTALNEPIDKGYLYFPASSLNASQAAGFYYVEMSSNTAGIAYNNTYTPGTDTNAVEPTSKTAFSGAVPGGTGVTPEITLAQYTVKGGAMGQWGSVFTDHAVSCTTSSNNKTVRIRFGGELSTALTISTAPILKAESMVRNQGDNAIQIGMGATNHQTTVGSENRTLIDTNFDSVLTISISKAAATDNSLLRSAIFGIKKWF
jgi:hypothetical protein